MVALLIGCAWPVWRGRGLKALRGPSHHIAGAYHVHSDRSHDSSVTPEAWALAAAALGLDFIVLTDHNVMPQPPRLLHGVLVLFEREASVADGHRVEWHKTTIAAHPFDRVKPWRGRIESLSGVEIASASATARAVAGRLYVGLVPALLLGLLRPEAGLAQLYARDDRALQLWDEMDASATRLSAGLCSADAHGWLPLRHELSVWRTVLPHLPTKRPLQLEQAEAVLAAIAEGRSLCIAGLLPAAAHLSVIADHVNPSQDIQITARLQLTDDVPGYGHENAHLPPMRLRLLRDGQEVCTSTGRECRVSAAMPGVYRAEVAADMPQFLRPARSSPVMYSTRLRLPAVAAEP